MKIAYLANVRFPSERAHSVQIVHMCNAFSTEDTAVTLFVNERVDVPQEKIEKEYNIDLKFSVKRISHGLFIPTFMPTYYFSELYFASSFLITQKQSDFDFIYSRHEWIVWFLSIFIPARKLVWESHEAKLNFPARKLLNKKIKTVVISEGIFEDYVAYGVPLEQLHVAHDGIDESFFGVTESKFLARARLGLPQDENIVMYIGGFDGWKGVETFFAAADSSVGVRFVAIGGSPEQVAIFSKKYPRVLFLGQLPYAYLKDNQQAADVLVVPNSGKTELSSRYTSPLKLFAHMASGVPIVASDIPSLVSVTGRGLVTLVPSDNAEALARGVCDVVEDYNNKVHQAQELKKISLRYTWTQRAENIINFISVT